MFTVKHGVTLWFLGVVVFFACSDIWPRWGRGMEHSEHLTTKRKQHWGFVRSQFTYLLVLRSVVSCFACRRRRGKTVNRPIIILPITIVAPTLRSAYIDQKICRTSRRLGTKSKAYETAMSQISETFINQSVESAMKVLVYESLTGSFFALWNAAISSFAAKRSLFNSPISGSFKEMNTIWDKRRTK